MRKVTYLTLAIDKAKWLNHSLMLGCHYNAMISVAQQVCEFALKQIITDNLCNNTTIMGSHNLRSLYTYVVEDLGYELESIQKYVSYLSNFLYNTSYPGKDAFFADSDEIETAVQYAIQCLDVIKKYCYDETQYEVTQ